MQQYLYVGTWNNIEAPGLGFARGVYGFRLDARRGTLEPLGLLAETMLSADSLAASPDGRTLYVSAYNSGICVRSWPFPGAPRCGVAAYAIAPETGALRRLDAVDGLGDMPSEIRTDATGGTLALANYYGGNVVTWRVAADGSLGAVASAITHQGTSRREVAGPHPHGLAFSADNRRLFVADLGLDRLYVYRFDAATSTLTPDVLPYLAFAEGEGPRHVAVHPNGRWLYVVTEDGGEIHLLRLQAEGRIERGPAVSVVPEGTGLKLGSAQVRISADGHFLYANHRPCEHIAAYAIDADDGRLSLLQFAHTNAAPRVPWEHKSLWQMVQTGARSFAWDRDGTWVVSANLGDNALVLLRRDGGSGRLEATGTVIPTPQPAFALFVTPT